MKYTLLCIFLLIGVKLFAQVSSNGSQNMLIGINGSPLTIGAGNNVEGSPYYSSDYCNANIISSDGRFFNNVKSKINLQNNTLVYLSVNDEEMIASLDLLRIEFIGSCLKNDKPIIFKSGFPNIDLQTSRTLYQQLDSGNFILLKSYNVLISKAQSNGLNPTAPNLIYQKSETFYAFKKESGIIKLSRNIEDILNLLKDKRSQLEIFISSNKLKPKKEDDLIKIFNYYNQIN